MQKQILCTTVLVETSPQALPLGAACIASAIKNYFQDEDVFDVQLKDYSLEDKDLRNGTDFDTEKVAEKIAAKIFGSYKNLYMILFSVYVWNHKILEQLSKILKSKYKNLITIAGGPEVTANPFAFSSFDYTIAGEGEKSVPELLQKLLNSETEFNIPGIYDLNKSAALEKVLFLSKDEKEILGAKGEVAQKLNVVRSETPLAQELTSPYLDGTIDPKKYGGVLWELARGCPFKCSYCYESKGEKKCQFFPMERLQAELELFAREKIPQAFVLDPTYNVNKKRALEILKMIKKTAPDMFFYFEARAEFIDRELAKAFASTNCCLQFGLQSSNPEVLKKVNRTLDKNVFKRNINLLNEAGAVFGFDLIFGLPGDNISGFKQSIDFAMQMYPNNLELFCLSVLPGTTLYDEATELGLTWQKNPPYHVVDNFTFPPEDLLKAQEIATACNIFYNQGRAVPWFNNVLRTLKIKASVFFSDFVQYLKNDSLLDENGLCKEELCFDEILEIQLAFITAKYALSHLKNLIPLATDLITLNAAMSRFTADGTESVVNLHYHPDDLMSEYAADLIFFAKNCRQFPNKTKIFRNKNGMDWKTIK